jgi:hypothetical protein
MTESIVDNEITHKRTVHRKMLRAAREEYWHHLDLHDSNEPYFSYQSVDDIQALNLRMLDGELLTSDFRDIINAINAWRHRLDSWFAWNQVIVNLEEDHAWNIRFEFTEPLAYFCMNQPSSFRDLLTKFATMAIHLGNLNYEANYKDELLEDKQIFKRLQKGHAKPYECFLTRDSAESQFRNISNGWQSASRVIELIECLDNDTYKERTKGWRNKSAHYIAPRFDFGYTQLVTRSVGFKEALSSPANVSNEKKSGLSEMQISYGFGGTEALSVAEAHRANREQYDIGYCALRACEQIFLEMSRRKAASK